MDDDDDGNNNNIDSHEMNIYNVFDIVLSLIVSMVRAQVKAIKGISHLFASNVDIVVSITHYFPMIICSLNGRMINHKVLLQVSPSFFFFSFIFNWTYQQDNKLRALLHKGVPVVRREENE